jgi:DNA topoisomerase-1
LEELGIGRPSTYASIIDTILARDYVFKLKRGNVLVPTWTAFAVCQLLEWHFEHLIDYKFTAEMEDQLDAISRGELGHLEYLRRFYYGDGHPGLKPQIEQKASQIDAREVNRILIGTPPDGGPVYVRIGPYGPYLEQGRRRASIPERMPPDELTLPLALEMLDKASAGQEPLGICPQTNKPVYLKVGRFGPYVQRGDQSDGQKPHSVGLLKGMRPEDVTLEVALKLLSMPRTLGVHPDSGEVVVVYNGRFGPYVKCGQHTRSLPDGLSPLDVTLEQALELLAQPPTGRNRRRAEILKVFEASPVTQQPVRLMEGRYGPYVTDGVMNASLPKGMSVEQVDFQSAVALLQARAEKGTAARVGRRRAAGKRVAGEKTKAATSRAGKKAKSTKKKTSTAANAPAGGQTAEAAASTIPEGTASAAGKKRQSGKSRSTSKRKTARSARALGKAAVKASAAPAG